MHLASLAQAIRTNSQFEVSYRRKVKTMLATSAINRGPAHATQDGTMALTHELMHLSEVFEVDRHPAAWAQVVRPNLPWAEDHFGERVCGEPLNPAPSEAWWPYAREGNAEHKKGTKFSHTYPERYWPKQAGESDNQAWDIDSPTNRANFGIRFPYGDLADLCAILLKNSNSRQAYLPVWFPEDLAAAVSGERVPCSMGYHLIKDGKSGNLDCVYTMRSCDIVRFYRDDIYMAGRLLQYVGRQTDIPIGNLVVRIDNLHCFPDDRPFLESLFPSAPEIEDPRASYNFGALG